MHLLVYDKVSKRVSIWLNVFITCLLCVIYSLGSGEVEMNDTVLCSEVPCPMPEEDYK